MNVGDFSLDVCVIVIIFHLIVPTGHGFNGDLLQNVALLV